MLRTEEDLTMVGVTNMGRKSSVYSLTRNCVNETYEIRTRDNCETGSRDNRFTNVPMRVSQSNQDRITYVALFYNLQSMLNLL